MPGNEETTYGKWLLILLIQSVPVVNIVFLAIWAFGGMPEWGIKNYARAVLTWTLAGTAAAVAFFYFALATVNM